MKLLMMKVAKSDNISVSIPEVKLTLLIIIKLDFKLLFNNNMVINNINIKRKAIK